MAIDSTGLAAYLSSVPQGYRAGLLQQAQVKAAQMQNQDQEDIRNLSLDSILGQSQAMDPTTQTIMAMSGQGGGGQQQQQAPLLSPSMVAQGGGTAQQQPNPGAPMMRGASGLQVAPGAGGQTMPSATPPMQQGSQGGGSPMPSQAMPQPSPMPQMPQGQGMGNGVGGLSLTGIMQKLKSDPRNKGIPDIQLLGAASKLQSAMNPDSKLLLQLLTQQQKASTDQQRFDLEKRGQDLTHQDRQAAEQDRSADRQSTNDLRLQLAQLGMGKSEAGKWQVVTDPANNTQYRYNAETGKATSLDGSQPYSPAGQQKIGGGAARSGPAMALQKFMQTNPNASPDDVENFMADYGSRVKAARDFGTGPLGNSIRSVNTAVQHLETAREAATAMGNKDVQGLNKVKNAWEQQFGSPLPTNFDAIRQVVGQEVVKAIVAGGGGVSERQEAAGILSRANSPAQLNGAIDQIQKLMAGQLNSLKNQYQHTTKLDDFDQRFLMPETQKAMKGAGYEKQGTAQSAEGQQSPGDNDGWKIEPVQ